MTTGRLDKEDGGKNMDNQHTLVCEYPDPLYIMLPNVR